MIAASSSPAPGHSERYHALDALRAFALLLGVAFHAAESFQPGVAIYWAIEDVAATDWLGLFRHASHAFRMEVFFLIAGFFARLLYHRRGPLEFWRNRIQRILLPLVVGWLILYPLLVFLWLWGAQVSGRLVEFGVPPDLVNTPIALLAMGFFLQGQFVAKFDLTHLWFLHQLLILYAGWMTGRWAWRRLGDRSGRGLARLDRAFAAWCAAPWRLLPWAALTIPMLMLMDSWDVDTPKESLLPHGPTTLLYGLFFGVGWMLHRQPRLLPVISRHGGRHLLAALLLTWPTGVAAEWMLGPVEEWLGPIALHWLYATLYALMMWAFVLGFLGLFMRFCHGHSPTWRYVADSSYWIYLAHLPLIVALQITVGLSPRPWFVKYPLILGIAVPLLFASYHFLVRSSFLGVQLNGRRYPFQNPFAGDHGRWAWGLLWVGCLSAMGWAWLRTG